VRGVSALLATYMASTLIPLLLSPFWRIGALRPTSSHDGDSVGSDAPTSASGLYASTVGGPFPDRRPSEQIVTASQKMAVSHQGKVHQHQQNRLNDSRRAASKSTRSLLDATDALAGLLLFGHHRDRASDHHRIAGAGNSLDANVFFPGIGPEMSSSSFSPGQLGATPCTFVAAVATADSPSSFSALRLNASDIHLATHWPEPANGMANPVHVLVFYPLLYVTFAILYVLCFKLAERVRLFCAIMLRRVALVYWRFPRLAPITASCFLFGLSGYLAQLKGFGNSQDSTWVLAIAACGLFYTICPVLFYEWMGGMQGIDLKSPKQWMGRIIYVQLFHLLLYLPLAVVLFIVLSEVSFRSAVNASEQCIVSSFVALPGNFGASTAVVHRRALAAYKASLLFWPLSNLVSFSLVQQWSPSFGSSWDGIVGVFWNLYLLIADARSHTAPPAIGPILDSSHEDPVQKQEAAVDCSTNTLKARGEQLYDLARLAARAVGDASRAVLGALWEITKYIWALICQCAHYAWELIKARTNDLGVFLYWLAGYILRWFLYCILVAFWFACRCSWWIFALPFRLFDTFKWYMPPLMLIPQIVDYAACPCPLFPK